MTWHQASVASCEFYAVVGSLDPVWGWGSSNNHGFSGDEWEDVVASGETWLPMNPRQQVKRAEGRKEKPTALIYPLLG